MGKRYKRDSAQDRLSKPFVITVGSLAEVEWTQKHHILLTHRCVLETPTKSLNKSTALHLLMLQSGTHFLFYFRTCICTCQCAYENKSYSLLVPSSKMETNRFSLTVLSCLHHERVLTISVTNIDTNVGTKISPKKPFIHVIMCQMYTAIK